MLIRLLATNFLSFNEETEFNMLASSDQRTHKNHVYSRNGLDLLKGAALYGANGAGKSNFVRAIYALQMIVQEGGKSQLNNLETFKLSPDQHKPTTLEVEFINNEIPFLYGITIQDRLVVEEWLCISALGDGEDEILFHRILTGGELTLQFAEKYKQTDKDQFRLKFYQDELLKNDELLLTELANLKEGFAECKSAFNWFNHKLAIIFPHSKPDSLAVSFGLKPHFKEFTNDYIRSLHTGVDQIDVLSIEIDDFFGQQNGEIIDEIRRGLQGEKQFMKIQSSGRLKLASHEELTAVMENGKPVVKQLITKHKKEDGQSIDFALDEESDGTVRLLDFVGPLYLSIHQDTVVIIDEIDQSIHPALLKELVRKFMGNPATKGQLIFTTHESNLLDQQLFRRDEIWFVEKHNGATQLYPLSEFDIRLDLDIRKGYLNGRFGAIPFLGNLKDLNWEQYAEA